MQALIERIRQIEEAFNAALNKLEDESLLPKLKQEYLGKKAAINQLMKEMSTLSPEDRPRFGQLTNELRSHMQQEIAEREERLAKMQRELAFAKEKLDVTMPGKEVDQGLAHPLTQIIDSIVEVFRSLGFHLARGPEVELVINNFSLLRIDENHPARDERDSFYISEEAVLRTQTSPVQIRAMQALKPPIKIICPGRCYRSDTPDATHTPVFHQIEGLVIDRGISMADLVGHLELFAKSIFGTDSEIRLRPHHFPFTEPSCEVDISCWTCHGAGLRDCSTCRGEGWIEILGAGMVHPEVIENCGIDSNSYSGFAFGLGVERTAMGRFAIDDIRYFYENDLRFLRQFK